MGRQLTASVGFPATARLTDKKGSTFTGTLMGYRTQEMGFGPKMIFSFKVIDADCAFSKDKLPYEPAEGEVVEIIPSTVLQRQLEQATVGKTIAIEYMGLGKKGKGHAPHLFNTVEQ